MPDPASLPLRRSTPEAIQLRAAFHAAPIYAIYDTQLSADLPFAEVIAAWLGAGIRVIQYRCKGEFGPLQIEQCRNASRQAREAGAFFLVNDRADVALLVGADGVHVGQEDLAPVDVRLLLPPPRLVGHSTHNPAQLAAALEMPIDYVAVGPVFPTGSKVNPDPVVGLGVVAAARRLTQLPVVAIGGITVENVRSVLQAGVDAVAMISSLLSDCSNVRQVEIRAGELLSAAILAERPALGAL